MSRSWLLLPVLSTLAACGASPAPAASTVCDEPAEVVATDPMIDEDDVVVGSCWDWAEAVFNVGLTVSYAGGHVDEPARYGSYDLTEVFRVVRMDD